MNSLPFRPIQDLVICVPRGHAEERTSGLVIPFDSERAQLLVVVGIGPGRYLATCRRTPMKTRPGLLVVVNPTRTQAFRYHDIEYIAVREEHVIAIAGKELKPLNDFVIAEQLPTEHVNPGGRIVIPGVADDRDEATLLHVGPGRLRDDGAREAMTLRVGDRVLYNKRMGDHFRYRDRALVAFREEHVVCVTEQHASAAD